MTDFFKNINTLALYPTETDDFHLRFDRLRPFFKSLHSLNYAEVCHREGFAGAELSILRFVRENAVGLVLAHPFATDYQLSVEFYASLRAFTKVVFWFADDTSYFDSFNKYYAQAADAVMTADHLSVHLYRRLEIPALVFREVPPGNTLTPQAVAKDTDVSFVGDMRKRGRREYIELLRGAGIGVAAYGLGTENGYLPSGSLSEVFSRSRINLNFSQTNALDWRNGDDPMLNRIRQNTGRPSEIALSGAFCLSEYSPSLGEMFRIGEEIDCFADGGELLEKVRFYLANPDRREAMAQAAWLRARKDCAEGALTEEMMGGLAALLKGTPPRAGQIYLSRDFLAREINSLTYSLFLMLRRGRPLEALLSANRLLRRGPVAFLRGFPGGLLRAISSLLGRLRGARYERTAKRPESA